MPEGTPHRRTDPRLPEPVDIAGTQVHPVSRTEAAELVASWAAAGVDALVVTPNVDHVVRLREDDAFAQAYAAARLRLCDGAPLAVLSALLGNPVARVTGADLFLDVCRLAARDGLRVFVAGGMEDVLAAGLARLRREFPGLHVAGHSPPLAFEGTAADVELRQRLSAADPDVVMVCFGAPRSEIWAAEVVLEQPGVYLCVGAAIDFAAGARRRAPVWVQHIGAEWLFRLAQEPRRLWRRYLMEDVRFLGIAAAELWRRRVAGRRARSG